MHETLEAASRTLEVRTVEHSQLGAGHERGVARRAELRRHERSRGILWIALVGYGPDDLWDHLAGALHLDHVANAEILPRHEVEVVERRELHHRAANLDRLQHCVRVDRPRSPDIHANVEQLRLGN